MNTEVMNYWQLAFELAEKLKEMNGYDNYQYVHEVLLDEVLNETGYTVFQFYKHNKLIDELRIKRYQ